AHALGTLARMYPGRIPWIALGSGEAINERTVGAGWPDKDERDARLAEAAVIVRRLLAGDTVDHEGLLRVEKAKLWSLPDDPPRLIGAALSVGGARRVAAWADGLLTSCADLDELRRIVEAFRANGGAGKPIHLKVELSWADTERAALEQAHRQWRYLLPGRRASQELKTPDEFDAASRDASMVEIRKLVNVSSRPEDHIAWLRKRLDIGLASIDIHDVGENQSAFIETFGREVLPELRQTIAVAAGDEP
ncbi:LLM class flavin-dependent oxidoreductase, partial [bacterium]